MLSIAKLTLPALADIIPRERLFTILEEKLKKPLTWLESPGGSGKTSLVGSYLNGRNLSYLWYKIDSGDSDIASFFYFMGIACQKFTSKPCQTLPLLMPEYHGGIHVFTQRYFEELGRRLPRPFALVFDNYQEASRQSQLHEIMTVAVSTLPPGISAIIISRISPPHHFSRMQANSELGIIGWNEIRLTENETRRIVNRRLGLSLDAGILAGLHATTEGWVAGLVLLMEGMKRNSFPHLTQDAARQTDIFKYFANEAFGKMEPEVQEFLLRTSFLPTMTVPLAQALTGTNSAESILQELYEHNYFTERRQESEPVYLYHNLFRQFLIARAQEFFTDAEIIDIKRQAATLLMNGGYIEEAASLCIEAEDWKMFIPFVLEHAPALMAQGRGKTLEDWLMAIPDTLACATPWILYWKGICALPSSPKKSRDFFEQAFHLFEGEDDPGVFLAWSGAVDTFFFEFSNFILLDSWIHWLDARMLSDPTFPSMEIEARVAASMTSALIWRHPDHPNLLKWLQSAVSLSKYLSSSDSRIRAYLDISIYHLWMGEVSEGWFFIEQIKKLAAANSTSTVMALSAKHAEVHFLNSNIAQAETALQIVADGLELSSKTGVHILDLHLYAHGVQSSINAGNVELMRKYLTGMERVLPSLDGMCGSLFYYLSAWANLFLNNAQKAVFFARKSVQEIVQAGIPVPEAMNRTVTAVALCDAGHHGEAVAHLQMMAKINKSIGSLYLDYLYHLIKAHVEFSRNNALDGLTDLQKALEVGKRKDDLTTMTNFLRPQSMSRLCAKALSAGIEVDHVQTLISKLRLTPDPTAIELESWPWPVKIYTLGRFSLTINGETVQASGKAQKKPILLLKALLALGGRDVRAETLTDILWPEADGDSGHNAFTTTLARLRRMIGNDKTLKLYDGRVSLDNRHCWVDRWVFERLLSQAETMTGKTENDSPGTPLNGIFLQLANLYRGHFLRSDVEEPWTAPPRERLKMKYRLLLLKTGRNSETIGADEAAVTYYRKGVEIDPLAEELYQKLISALIRLGRCSEAILAYRQCRDNLKAELGIAPSDITKALEKKILSGIQGSFSHKKSSNCD